MSQTNPAATMVAHPYQLFARLRPEEYDALKADITRRGVLVAVEYDTAGNILDGHHRAEIATALGIDFPNLVRDFATEDEKREHVLKINLLRRHLGDVSWAKAFKQLAEMRGARLGKGAGRPKAIDNSATVAELADEMGVSERTAYERLELLDLPEETQQAIEDKQVSAKEARRDERQRQKQAKRAAQAASIAAEPQPLPTGPFRVIVIDPPWRYDNRAEDITHQARNPYPDMTVDEIGDLDVESMAHEDAILWLWTTNAFMHDAFHIVSRWGFTSKTVLTWVKDHMVTGDWLRGQTEHAIFAVRGKPIVSLTNQTTVLHGKVREHSRKPDEFYALVEALCPGSKVDVFSREPRDGWAAFGDQIDAFGRAA